MKVNRQDKYLNLGKLGTIIVFGMLLLVAIAFLGTEGGIAQEAEKTDSVVLFKPPPEDEQPEKTEGAASRQNRICSQDLQKQTTPGDRPNLTALVPQRNYGLTVAERPTFWVYLPQTSARQAILSIKTEDSNPHWQQSIDLTGETGTTGIKLSDDAPGLEIGKNYQWAVILVCGDRPHPNDPVVTAGIKRIYESQISRNVSNNPTGTTKAAWYARHGIWYDALNVLIAEKPAVDNWNDLWVGYLQSGGLEELANEPVVSY